MPDNRTNPSPQFSTAEYAAAPGSERCKSCNQTLGSQYYRVNGALTCAHCAEQTKLRLPVDTHPTFVRGLFFGIGGAIVGLSIYSAFGIITGLVIGYVSLAVGYIVGKAIMKGSNGIGGRRYQIAAVLLTYSAVSMSAIPIGISQFMKQKKAQQQNLVNAPPAAVKSEPSASNEPAAEVDEASQPSAPKKPKPSLGAAIGMLAIAGLTSPFLELQDPFHGVIGLIILFVGIRIAWSLTAGTKLDILGPFKTTSQSANASPGSDVSV